MYQKCSYISTKYNILKEEEEVILMGLLQNYKNYLLMKTYLGKIIMRILYN